LLILLLSQQVPQKKKKNGQLKWRLTAARSRRTQGQEERQKVMYIYIKDKFPFLISIFTQFCPKTRGPNVQGSCIFIRLLDRVIIQNYSLVEEFFSEKKEMTLDAAEHP
jgi:hypothetical protein